MDSFESLYRYSLSTLKGMLRFKWWALAIAWFGFIGGLVAISFIKDNYESKSRFYVDTDSVLMPLLEGLTVDSNISNRVELITAALLSRPNLENVASQIYPEFVDKTEIEKDEVIQNLQEDINISGTLRNQNVYDITGDAIYEIIVHNENPVIAYNTVSLLLNSLFSSTFQQTRDDKNIAHKFLDDQIREHEARLIAAEERLAKFKQDNVGLMPDDDRDYYGALRQAVTKHEQTLLDLNLAVAKRNELRRQIEGEEPVFGLIDASGSANKGPNQSAIAQLRGQLDKLLLKYTELHPQVVSLKESIAELERKDAEKSAALGFNLTTQKNLATNPVYQTMKLGLSAAEVRVRELQSQAGSEKRNINKLEKSITIIPEVEAELARLDRDYQVTQTRYEELVERRESARLSDEADQSRHDEKFRIIDPPQQAVNPIWPNRILFITALLIAAIGSGLAFAFTLNIIRSVSFDGSDFIDKYGIPVFGIVGKVKDEGSGGMVLASFLFALLLATYAGSLVLIHINPDVMIAGIFEWNKA